MKRKIQGPPKTKVCVDNDQVTAKAQTGTGIAPVACRSLLFNQIGGTQSGSRDELSAKLQPSSHLWPYSYSGTARQCGTSERYLRTNGETIVKSESKMRMKQDSWRLGVSETDKGKHGDQFQRQNKIIFGCPMRRLDVNARGEDESWGQDRNPLGREIMMKMATVNEEKGVARRVTVVSMPLLRVWVEGNRDVKESAIGIERNSAGHGVQGQR
ncbi:hypothetical protein B0H19DRAFT_1235924 [Mycena capillaripes]|nr:hypothetical protein B0H19DRAFT_1235924 [Mycena capillaripes]